MARKRGNTSKNSREKILNAFDTAVDDQYYIKGLRHQQDIDLDNISDERIRQLLSNQVDSENDEDIDSDAAMGSGSDISLGEPESENEDEWGDSYDEAELLPLDEIWDLDTKEQEQEAAEKNAAASHASNKESKPKQGHHKQANDALVSDSGSKVAAESGSESSSESGSEPESESESEDSGSDSASDGLELDEISESSAEEDDETLIKAIKNVSGADDIGPSSHRLAEAGDENPFSLPGAGNRELSLQEIIPGTREGKTLAVPAPRRVQERADRSAALDLATVELGKWTDTVAANRQAEHIQFPINAPPEFEPATPFIAPASETLNPLEKNVSDILKESALADENAVSTFEEMAPSKLSIEEVRKRRDELRYMRELMYREEQRAKRIKKIKSKSFRKIHKRERERMQELEEGEDDEESIEKAERARALERATLRHRASSKWAKRMTDQGLTRDAGTRTEIEEMLRQGEALKQKIRGSFESEDESDGDSETELKRLEDENKDKAPKKGVLGMKFMLDADERAREENARRLRDDYSDAEDEEANIGRKSFNPAGQQLKRDLAAREESEGSDVEPRTAVAKNSQRSKKTRSEVGSETIEFRPREESEDDESDEAVDGKQIERTQSKSQSIGGATTGKGRRPEGKPSQRNVPQTKPIEDNPWLAASANGPTPGTMKLAKSSSTQSKQSDQKPGGKSNRGGTITVENTLGETMVREKDMTLQQQDLVREAFAGDDVVAEFEAEKRREAEEDGDQEIDETLPGWGTWSSEKPRVQKIRKITGVKASQRKDFKKGNVIINEKLNKKAAKYTASAVPFPFENRQQYERSLRMPMGQEWSTKDTFQRQTKPRVLVKRGTVIEPIKKPHSN